jgi:uncharacterized protein with LGFP repeats
MMDFSNIVAVVAGIVAISGGIAGIVRNVMKYRENKARLPDLHYPVWEPIRTCYMSLGGSSSRLGQPLVKEQKAVPSPLGTTGKVQRFTGKGDATRVWDKQSKSHLRGVSIYSSKLGAFPMWGSIGKRYEELGGTSSKLGFPTSKEKLIREDPKTWIQHFEGGSIFCEGENKPIDNYLG